MACGLVVLLMQVLGRAAMFLFIFLVIIVLLRSNFSGTKRTETGQKDEGFALMMRSHDPLIVWELLQKHVCRTQSFTCRFALQQFNNIVDGLMLESPKQLRHVQAALNEERTELKKLRRKEFLGLRKAPRELAIERKHVVPSRRQCQPAVHLLPEAHARTGEGTRRQ